MNNKRFVINLTDLLYFYSLINCCLMQILKGIKLLVIAVFCCLNGNSQDYRIENPDSLYRMFQIRSEYIYTFTIDKKKISDSLIAQVNTFDSIGRLIGRFNFDSKIKDLLKSKVVYEYHDRENKLKRSITTDNILGFTRIKEYTYNEVGKLTETVSYTTDKNGRGDFNKYEYDNEHKLKRIFGKTGVSGAYLLKTENQYQNGWLEKSTDYDEKGESVFYKQYFYDNSGRLKRQREYVNGRDGITLEYKYDDNGRCKERVVVFSINSASYLEQWSLDRTINTPFTEYYLYYPEGLCYEIKFEIAFNTTLARAYYSTEYPVDLQ